MKELLICLGHQLLFSTEVLVSVPPPPTTTTTTKHLTL